MINNSTENNSNILLNNLDRLHTTELGVKRIRNNLNLSTDNVVEYCIDKIKKSDCKIVRKGKNWYAESNNCVFTINAHSYTIITARLGSLLE